MSRSHVPKGGFPIRPHLSILAAAVLVASVLAVAGPTAALEDHQSHEHSHEAEHYPDCKADGGERYPSAFTVDPNPVDDAQEAVTGVNLFSKDDKVPVDGQVNVDGEHAATLCSGENWDGQDPNTQESDRNSEAGGNADEPIVDPGSGEVYVNPLWGGDCSGWNSDHHEDGCPGGTQRPGLTEVIHLRLTADGPGADDQSPEFTLYQNGEGWGQGRESVSVRVDLDEDGDRSDQGGWVGIYLEDGSDQASEEAFGPDDDDQPLCMLGVSSDCFDGNYLLIPFDPAQGGSGGEGDCTSHEYQSAQGNSDHTHPHSCTTDSSSFSLEFSYAWLETPGATTETPPTLP